MNLSGRIFRIHRVAIWAALMLLLLSSPVHAALTSPPTALVATTLPSGTIRLEWTAALGDGGDTPNGDIRYEIWRKWRDDAAYYRITDGYLGATPVPGTTTFIDLIDANDPQTNGNDIRMVGDQPDNTNAVWGYTYQYKVLGRDEDTAPGVETLPATLDEAVTVAAQCDNQPPQLEALTQPPVTAGEVYEGKVRADEHIVRVQIHYVDWSDYTGPGQFKVAWKINGGAETFSPTMVKISGGFAGPTILEGSLNLTGAADGDAVEWWISGQDNHRNPMISTMYPHQLTTDSVWLLTVDNTGPTISSTQYIDFTGDGVSAADHWVIRFNEDLDVSLGVSVDDFTIGPGAGGTFGTGANIFAGPLTNEVTIVLGASPNIVFVGPAGSRINQINYKGDPVRSIKDLAGNVAQNTVYTVNPRNEGGTDLPDGPRPKLTKAEFTDVNDDGNFNNPDTIKITLSKKLGAIGAGVVTDFVLPVTSDSFGTAPTQALDTVDKTFLNITLDATAVMRVVGVFNSGALTAGSSSGIDAAAATGLLDDFGNLAEQQSPNAGIDIVGTDTTRPTLVSAVYRDTLVSEVRNGLSSGDRLTLTFSRPVHSGLRPVEVQSFRLPVAGDNLDSPTFTVNPANRRELFVDFSSNPSVKVFGVYNGSLTIGSSSGVDVVNGQYAEGIVDIYGNIVQVSTPKDIASDDADGPRITPATANPNAVLFTDLDGNGPDEGDYLEVEFDEPIVLTATVIPADFQTQNMSLGTNPIIQAKDNTVSNRIIRITLGTSPNITTVGANRSQLDMVNGNNRIQNWAGINVRSDGWRNVEAASALGPKIIKAEYTDNGTDGLNAGDVIILTFDKPIIMNGGISAADFQLPVTGDTLGTGATFNTAGLNPDQLRIVLGTSPKIKVGGTFSGANTAQNAASGIDMVAGGTINVQDTTGNNARPNTPAGMDITPTDVTSPTLTTVVFTDVAGDGFTGGDRLTLTFSEPITCELPPAGNSLRNLAFNLPVTGDSLGQDPVTVINPQPAVNQIVIQFISTPNIKVAGLYNGNIATGSSSGMDISPNIPGGMITDVSGNTATPNPGTVGVNGIIDIGAVDAAGPTLLTAVYTDLDNNGPDAGDTVDLTFSEPILVNPLGVAVTIGNFNLVNGDFGTNPGFASLSDAVNNTVVRVTLGTNPTLQFQPPSGTVSTIDVNGPIQSITDISGNGAVTSTQKTITSGSTTQPYIIDALFSDVDNNGLDQGDTLRLGFNKEIFIGAITSGVFLLPATDGATRTDSLGTNPIFTKVSARTIEVTLDTGVTLWIPGTYSGPTGKASGIDIIAAGTMTIVDSTNNGAIARTTGPVDLVSVDTVSPKVVESYWSDENANGAVDSGDTLSVRFDMPILLGGNLTPAAFNLPVTGDRLNFSASSLSDPTTLLMTLSTPVVFTPRGTYAGTTLTAGSPSGIDVSSAGFPVGSITSASGVDAAPSIVVDIFSRDGTGPVLMAAEYEDLNRDSAVNIGDVVSITFSENIFLNGPTLADFNLVNANFGLNPTFGPGGGANVLKVTLDAGASLTFLGTNTSSVDVVGVLTSITDFSGNGAGQTTQKFITVKGAGVGPRMISASWTDNAPAGVSAGDFLHVVFNKDIVTANLDAADFVLPVGAPPSTGPADSIGTGAVFAQTDPRTIEITLGTGALFQPIGIFNPVTITPGSPSGIDVSTAGLTSGHIVDNFGYLAGQNTPAGVDITSSDSTGPVLLSATFQDLDVNDVDEGDRIVLIFNENLVVQTPLTVASGDFTITNGNLGTNPTFYYNATAPTQLVINLGLNPALVIRGVFPGDAAASGIDINAILTSITDLSGLGAHTNGGVDIGPFETAGPSVTGARYVDNNGSNALDFGDYVYVRFNEPIQFDGVSFADFTTPVALDSIGGAPVFAAGRDANEIRITLGSAPVLTPTGLFRVGVITGGSPSGIDVVNTNHITDVYGNGALASVAKDIDDGQGPYITAAAFTDLDNNAVDAGDRLRITFNEPIVINQNLLPEDFQLPVAFDTLGTAPLFAIGSSSNEVDITLGTNSVMTIPGTFSPLILGQWSPSGINLSATFREFAIVDLAGNSAVRSATPVDITGTDVTRPTLLAARWVDKGTAGVGSGDNLVLTFDRQLRATTIVSSDFYLPVQQNSLGTPLAVTPNDPATFTSEITIVMGSGARLTIPGAYQLNVHQPNDPSGIDVSPAMVAGHLMDVYGNTPNFSTTKDITGDDMTGPVLLTCNYWDRNNNGPDQGDILGLLFDKPVQFRNGQVPGADEFALPVTGNGFGATPIITQGTTSADIRITLGVNPVLTIPGVYTDTTNLLDPLSPSGIKTTGKPTGNLIDYSGNPPFAMVDTAAVDIAAASTVGPKLQTATIQDMNANWILDQGDRMTLVFDRAIALTAGFALTDLTRPIAGNSFGTGATFEVNAANLRQLYIGLGAGPNWTVEGTFRTTLTGPADPSGIGVTVGAVTITDLGGLPVVGGNLVDIADEYKPFILAATYVDTGNDGLGIGDLVNLRFSEIIQTLNLTVTDFALTNPTDTLGTGATFSQSTTDSVRITLGSNPSIVVAGVYPGDPTASGIDLATTFNSGHIRDMALNPATITTAKDIAPEDTQPPTVRRSVYGDANGNGIVDSGDTISVYFTKSISVSGSVRADFSVINGSLGTGGNDAVVKGSGTDEVIITLGATPLLNVEGVYPADATASAIDIGAGYLAGHIVTISGANAISSTPKDIEDLFGPVITGVVYTDTGLNGVGEGDLLDITFNRNIQVVGTVNAGAFILPVSGDSLGSNPGFVVSGARTLRVTMGPSSRLRVAGVFNVANIQAGSPSGINLSPVSQSGVTDAANHPARPALQPLDITGVETTPPTLDSVAFVDKDGNGVSAGDELRLTFSEAVFVDAATSVSDFQLNNGSFGNNPKFALSSTSPRVLIITLGQNAQLNLFGASQSSIGRSDATYVAGHITDIAGNDWAFGVQTGIAAEGTVSPKLVQATFYDVDSLGLGAGDKITLRFTVPIVVGAGAATADFLLPVGGDTFGGGAVVLAGASNREADIILGTGAKITIAGSYRNGVHNVGSPSGIDIAGTSTNITSIGGNPALANLSALDIGSTDVTAPVFTSGTLTGTKGAGLVRAVTDTIVLTATLDDASLKASDITADLRPLGGLDKTAASTYISGTATWLSFDSTAVRDSVEIMLTAKDLSGNQGSYRVRANVIQPAYPVIAEVAPGQVLRGSGISEFTVSVLPTLPDYCTGVDIIRVTVPVSGTLAAGYYYTNLSITDTRVTVAGQEMRVITTGNPAPGEVLLSLDTLTGLITAKFGTLYRFNNAPAGAIKITFKATIPQFSDEPDGKRFAISVDNSTDPAAVTAIDGNADGTAGNGDTHVVTVIGVKIQSIEERFVITPNFWKIIFTVKFNANMDVELDPYVTFKSLNSLQNEQTLTQLSFVDATWMGQAIVPFENFGFSGDYTLTVKNARDYIGSTVSTISMTKKFSPKFLIAATVHPSDERTLVLSTRYLQTNTDEVLMGKPTMTILQAGTAEALAVSLFDTERKDTYLGSYRIDATLSGQAQIDVAGYIGPSGKQISGKASTEFSTAALAGAGGGTLSAPDRNLAVDVPARALKRDVQLSILPDLSDQYPAQAAGTPGFPKRAPANAELQRVSAIYAVTPGGDVLQSDAFVSMVVTPGTDAQTGIFVEGENGWEFVGRKLKDGRISAATRRFGRFALLRDVRGPQFKLPEDDDAVYEKEFAFDVTDDGSGVDMNASQLTIDGQPVTARYDAAAHRMIVNLPERLVQGLHSLDGSLVDRLGNATPLSAAPVNAAGFMDLTSVMPWPNPARTTSRVRYTLGKNVSDLRFVIYDGSGRPVYIQKDFTPAERSAGTHDTTPWMLTNSRLRPVANGTYIYRMTATEGDKKIVRTGKIAVLR